MKYLINLIVISVWTIILSALCIEGNARAMSSPSSLKGLKAMAVGVSELPRELKDIGLTEESLYGTVVSTLKRSGVKINIERYAIAGEPDLLVDIFGGEFIEGVITYCIDVRLDQAVVLERDRRLRSDATTWSQKFIGVAGYGTKPDVIRKQLKTLIDVFVEEYLEKNP